MCSSHAISIKSAATKSTQSLFKLVLSPQRSTAPTCRAVTLSVFAEFWFHISRQTIPCLTFCFCTVWTGYPGTMHQPTCMHDGRFHSISSFYWSSQQTYFRHILLKLATDIVVHFESIAPWPWIFDFCLLSETLDFTLKFEDHFDNHVWWTW